MRFRLTQSTEVVLDFHHVPPPEGRKRQTLAVRASTEESPGTACKMYIGGVGMKFEDMKLVSEAAAHLYYKDKFDKEKGRKAALTKALDASPYSLNKSVRTDIWTAYLSRK